MEEKKKIREIDVMALVGKVWKEKKLLAGYVCVFAVIGVIVALSTPREYTAETILAPEMSSGGLGLSSNLADMASTFGIKLDKKSSVDALYPELYPDIFASTDFVRNLYDVKVRLKKDNTVRTFYEHITKDLKTPFWRLPGIWLSEMMKERDNGAGGGGQEDVYKISRDDAEICEGISQSILCLVDKKTSEITISYTDQDPLVASIIVDTLQRRLQEYITDYRTKKARIDYEYYKKLVAQMKTEFYKARDRYVVYADANQDLLLQSYVQKNEELENDMQQKFDSYKSVMASMQQAKAKIQEETPAFTIIQRPMMPHKPSSRPKIVTLLLFIILGVAVDAVWVLFLRDKVRECKGN